MAQALNVTKMKLAKTCRCALNLGNVIEETYISSGLSVATSSSSYTIWNLLLSACFILMSPIIICKYIRKAGNTDNISFAPFLTGFQYHVLWLNYGILAADKLRIYRNIQGVVFYSFFILFYFYYSNEKLLSFLQIAFIVQFLWVLILMNYTLVHPSKKRSMAASFANVFTLLFILWPMFEMESTFRSKEIVSFPFPVLFSLVQSCHQMLACAV